MKATRRICGAISFRSPSPLAAHSGLEMREARDVAARTRKALDDALSHRIDDVHEDDRHRSALALNSPHDRNADRDHDFGAGGEELRGASWPAPSVSGQPAQDELGILARDPADLVQGFAHCG